MERTPDQGEMGKAPRRNRQSPLARVPNGKPARVPNGKPARVPNGKTARVPNGKTGGPKRGRTADLYTASVALYQLSYRPV